MQAIVGILTALPQLINLMTEVWNYLQKISGGDPAGFIIKAGQAFAQLNAAKTEEDHAAAAKALADLIAHSPAK